VHALFSHLSSQPIAMIDGYNFNGAKAYKDSKLAIMMFANALHERYHRATGIAFSSIYPGCIAESPLFREKVRLHTPLHVHTASFWSALKLGALMSCGGFDYICFYTELSAVIPFPTTRAAAVVPQVLSCLHEVHHWRLRGGGGGGAAPIPGDRRSALYPVGCLLVVEWRATKR
jgi:hypothetical protein